MLAESTIVSQHILYSPVSRFRVVQRSGGRSVGRSAVDAFAGERSTFGRTIVQTQVDAVFQTFHPRAFHFGKQVVVRTEAFGLAQPTVFQSFHNASGQYK